MPRKRDDGGCSCGMGPRDVAASALCRIPGCPYPQMASGRNRPRVTERDLRHEANSFRFGKAMLRCEGYAPACSDSGRCLNDGACFASAPHLIAARMVESLIPTDGHARGLHLAYLRRVADMLREKRVEL